MKNSWVFLAGLTSLTLANLMLAAVSSTETREAYPPPPPAPAVAAPQLPAIVWLRSWGVLSPLPLPCGRFRGITRPVTPAGESAQTDTLVNEVW